MRTRDVDRLERFYRGPLGFELVRRNDARGSVWLDAGGALLMIERASPDEPQIATGTKELVAFAVEDKEAWRARLANARIALEDETPHTLYFRDPDGRRVAVSTWPSGSRISTPVPIHGFRGRS
jgi:catechol 2,3-dioxygenase-like lactoylglutathione lyase family enzyme